MRLYNTKEGYKIFLSLDKEDVLEYIDDSARSITGCLLTDLYLEEKEHIFQNQVSHFGCDGLECQDCVYAKDSIRNMLYDEDDVDIDWWEK